jgi:hypothetical protein
VIANGSIDLSETVKNDVVMRDIVGISVGMKRLAKTEIQILSTNPFMRSTIVSALAMSAQAVSPSQMEIISE